MDNSIIIKGTNNGINFILDEALSFDELKEKLKEKVIDSAKFLSDAKTAVSFTGRKLSDSEEIELLKVVKENSDLDVVCIIDPDEEKNAVYAEAVDRKIAEAASGGARIYKGNLRSGQSIESENSVVIIGDVNPGASVVSAGNIVVLGTLKGTAFAGCSGNKNCFVISLEMIPMQVRIDDIIARAPDNPEKQSSRETKIAYIENDCICISPLTKEIINTLTI